MSYARRTQLFDPVPRRSATSAAAIRPHTLKGDALVQARLTPETWRLEIVSDGATTIADAAHAGRQATPSTCPRWKRSGRQHGVKFLKAMQCLNIAQPLGQGLWEGVPLREVLKLAGRVNNIRRVYYWGFHNNDPKQLFQSSLSYTQVMETPPWDLRSVRRLSPQRPADLAPARRPGAHGRPVGARLQVDQVAAAHRPDQRRRANDTYAGGNNDLESYLKTAAYLDEGPERGPRPASRSR